MVRCNLCKLKIKLTEQDSKNIPSKYRFPKTVLRYALQRPYTGNVPKAGSLFLFYI